MAAATCAPVAAAQLQPRIIPQPLGGSRLAPAAFRTLLHAPAALGTRQKAKQRRQARHPAAASAAGDADSSGAPAAAAAAAPSGSRHAVLHDFCMCIPYGALLLAGGLVSNLLGWGQPAVVMMAVGGLQVGLSNLSLQAWRAGKSAATWTLSQAGLAGWLSYYAYRAVQQGVSTVPMGALLGLSAAMALFLVYNVAAGGNPPRRGTHAAAAEPATAPAS